jgi:hypothetical protein
MPTKRARITDRDPLTPTDKVLAQYEQVNKSSSQLPESADNEKQQPLKSTSTQVDKLASQPPKKSASQQVDNLDLTSQQANFSTIEEVNNLESTSQQSEKSTSQQVKIAAPTRWQVNNPKIQEVRLSTSQQVGNSIITSQQPNKLTSEQAKMTELDQSTSKEVSNIESQEADQPASQPVNQPTIRKATFQLDATVIEDLDRYHLQLQIDLGKRNAPYKEIIVEEAIAQWLERATKSPDRVVKSLLKRQEQRSV